MAVGAARTRPRSDRAARLRVVDGAPALARLRAGTRALHAELDAALTGGSVPATESDYRRVLVVLHALHARVDGPLRPWAAREPWARHEILPLLPDRAALYAADLRALGHEPADGPVADARSWGDAEGLAALYLLAGSTKGARMLRRGLPTELTGRAGRGLADAAGDPAATLWRRTREALVEPRAQDLADLAVLAAQDLLSALLVVARRGS